MHNKKLKVIGDNGKTHEQSLTQAALNWSLTISGQVKKPVFFTLKDLWSLPTEKIAISIECVSAGKIYGKNHAFFSGIKLSEIIARVFPEEGVKTVKFISYAPGACGSKREKHTTSLEYDYCLNSSQIMLASALNDKPLPYKNGGPLRLIAGEERYFYKSLKWLSEIQFLKDDIEEHKGTWEKYAGYHNIARIQHQEKFSPFICRIIGDIDGELQTEEISLEKQDVLLQEMYQQKNFSFLIASKIKWDIENLNNCIFSENKYYAQLRGINFANTSFLNAKLSYGNFSLSKFRFAKFSDENGAQSAEMNKCDFEGADFIKAHLQNVSMRESFLRGARFYPETENKKHCANVKGLDIRGSIGVDSLQLSWLKEDGAIVDEEQEETREEDGFGYLPFVEVRIFSDNSSLLSLLGNAIQSENYCYHFVINEKQLTLWQHTHGKYVLQQFLANVHDTYFQQITIVILPEPVWLLCSTKDTDDGK